MHRWVLAALVAAVVVLPGSAGAAQGGCVLQGTASIPAGLTLTNKPISFSFTGKLTNCKGVKGVTGGTVTASGSGTGSCGGNTTSGSATIRWNTGQTSSLGFTTNGKGVVVIVQGTISSGLFAGTKVKSGLAFYTTKAAQCNSAGGLKAASFAGPATLGV
jgi:hypothetical protein